MARAIRRLGIGLLACLGVLTAYTLMLVFPEPFFSSVTVDGNIRLYGRAPLGGSAHELLTDVRGRVRRSGIYDARIHQRIFITATPAWYAFFNGPYRSAMARNMELGNAIFLPQLDLQHRRVTHFDGRTADATEILAHEMAHTLMQDRLGLFHVWRLPWWKREGFASYVGNTALLAEPPRYERARATWAYLSEVRHRTFDQIIADRETEDDIERQMARERDHH